MVMVYMGGHISGAHYNPAVTLAVLMRGKISGKEAGVYMLTQILAGFVAALCFYLIWGKGFGPAPDSEINVLKPLFTEGIFTFALVSVVLNVATNPKTSGNSYYGLAIGFTVFAAAVAGGSISGGAFNPAVAIGPLVVNEFMGNCGCDAISDVWIYLVGPFAGGAAAAIGYKMMNEGE
jgi:aquaporin Z